MEWLIGHYITLTFEPAFFSNATFPGPWTGFVHDTATHKVPRAKTQIEQFKEQCNIPITHQDPSKLTIMDAVRDTYPKAQTCNDLLNAYLGQHVVVYFKADSKSESDHEQDAESGSSTSRPPRQRAQQAKNKLKRAALVAHDWPMNQRSKHINTRVFKLKEFVVAGVMGSVKIESEQQVADNLTKPPPKAGVELARGIMSGKEAACLIPALLFM